MTTAMYLTRAADTIPRWTAWMGTATVNAPAARELQSAVWTGGEMIIWGGTDHVDNLNTGGRYNPGHR